MVPERNWPRLGDLLPLLRWPPCPLVFERWYPGRRDLPSLLRCSHGGRALVPAHARALVSMSPLTASFRCQNARLVAAHWCSLMLERWCLRCLGARLVTLVAEPRCAVVPER